MRKQAGKLKANSNQTTTDSLHRFLPNVRFTELRSREGKSTVRIDRKSRLVVVKVLENGNAAQRANVTEPYIS